MSTNTKATLISIASFAIIFLGIHTLLTVYLNIEDTIVSGVTSAISASLLTPRRVMVQKQSGKEIQLKWLFSKKMIRVK